MEKINIPKKGQMVLGANQYYDMDCHKTKINNNVLVVGASGTGKTRGIVEPNILRATGSYIISDPKGRLYDQYKKYLENKGYEVLLLDFTKPQRSKCYNPMKYIHTEQDIVKLAHMIIYAEKNLKGNMDPFWDQAASMMLSAAIGYLWQYCQPEYQNLNEALRILNMMEPEMSERKIVGKLFEGARRENPDSVAIRHYDKLKNLPERTFESIHICATTRLAAVDTKEMRGVLKSDDLDIPGIGRKKTALFVCVSDNDRSLDSIVNIFFTQAMNELCAEADSRKSGSLKVPVQFILDDFATNVSVEGFPRMISSIRSRGISTMLMIQAEGQLQQSYEKDAETIISNCDSYVYLGSNDLETCKRISERLNVPLDKILYMPVGKGWLFRRGNRPVSISGIDIDEYEKHITRNNCDKTINLANDLIA